MIDNPVGVFVAQTNLEAQVVANLLKDAGIEAAAMEDMSPAGMYSLGTLDQIHKPKVFVSKEHLGAAREVIVRYQARSKSPQDSPPISCCYFCGAECDAGDARCPACGQVLELDEAAGAESSVTTQEQSSRTTSMGALRGMKRLVALVILAPILSYLGLILILVLADVLGFGR